MKEETWIIDGYNLIWSWDHLKQIASKDISEARDSLIHEMSEFQTYQNCQMYIVFDAYRVKKLREVEKQRKNFYICFTNQGETADQYIEQLVKKLKGTNYVITDDLVERSLVVGSGAICFSTHTFQEYMVRMRKKITIQMEKRERDVLANRLPLHIYLELEKWRKED